MLAAGFTVCRCAAPIRTVAPRKRYSRLLAKQVCYNNGHKTEHYLSTSTVKSTDTHVTAVLWSLHKEGRDRVELVVKGARVRKARPLASHAFAPRRPTCRTRSDPCRASAREGEGGLHGHEELSLSGEKGRVRGVGVGE